jgi:branched-subunit amino acid transport protein
MDQQTIFLTIIGMMAVTYLPRLLPTLLVSSWTLPDWIEAWLRHVPVAVLSAMLFPAVLARSEQIVFTPDNLFLLAAFPTLLVAWKSRSLFGSVITGVIVVAAARFLLGQ